MVILRDPQPLIMTHRQQDKLPTARGFD